MLESGVVLSERYRLDDRLATGGMGDVWRATDLLLNRTVAVKALLPALIDDPGFVARFMAEVRIMATLNHPGIVDVYDYGQSALPTGRSAVYLVMEWVDGRPLSERIADGPLSVAETLSMVAQAARALQAAHDGGVIHRDVKPANLLITEEGVVRLADFGVARSSDGETALTATNAVLGTAKYMAPEQALGHGVTAAADIYGLGAVAYHCLAGHPPFAGETAVEIALHHVQDPPPPLPDHVPAPVQAMVAKAMEKEPALRFATAEAFAAAAEGQTTQVDDTLADLPVVVAPRQGLSRRTKLMAAGAGLAAALLAVFVFADLANTPAKDTPWPTITESIIPAGPSGVDKTKPSTKTQPPSSSSTPTAAASKSSAPPPSPAPTSKEPDPTPTAEPTLGGVRPPR